MPDQYKRLGAILVENGVVSNLQLAVAVAAQRTSNRRLGEIIVQRGYATEEQIAGCLAQQYGYPFIENPESVTVQPDALQLISAEDAVTKSVLPFRIENGTLHCMIWDPIDFQVTDALRMQTRKTLSLYVAPKTRLDQAIRSAFGIGTALRVDTCETEAALPERFQAVSAIHRDGMHEWVRAYDNALERNVQIVAVHSGDHAIANFCNRVKQFGAANHQSVAKVFDFFQHESWLIAVLEDNPGETLASILQSRGPRNPAQSALICAQVAEACDVLVEHGKEAFITPVNVLVYDRDVVLAPSFAPPVGWTVGGTSSTDRTISAIGLLLATCLTAPPNWELTHFERERLNAAPKKLHEIYRRCVDRSSPDRFVEPVQVAAELKAYRWNTTAGAGQDATSKGEDRDALLTSLDAKAQAKPSFWQKLFGRAS